MPGLMPYQIHYPTGAMQRFATASDASSFLHTLWRKHGDEFIRECKTNFDADDDTSGPYATVEYVLLVKPFKGEAFII